MACKNTKCKYNDANAANGCKLFPGASWLNCRGASVVTINKSVNQKSKESRK